MIPKTYVCYFILFLFSSFLSAQDNQSGEKWPRSGYTNDLKADLSASSLYLPLTYQYHLHGLGIPSNGIKVLDYINWSEIRYARRFPDARISDYTIYSTLGKFQTLSEFKSLPISGAYSYIRLMYPIQLTDRLSVRLGAFASKSLIQKKTINDFGFVGNLDFRLLSGLYLNVEHQQSVMDNPEKPASVKSLYPNTNSNINIMIMPKENIKFKIGVLKD